MQPHPVPEKSSNQLPRKMSENVPSAFEQIPWEDWIVGYWVPSITMQPIKLFLKVFIPPGPLGAPYAEDPKMTSAYEEGDDGYTYYYRLDLETLEEYLEPIYTLRIGGNP